jgi:hypothetical protein
MSSVDREQLTKLAQDRVVHMLADMESASAGA